MREIKFRGKRVDNGEWAYGSLVLIGDQVFIFPSPSNTRLRLKLNPGGRDVGKPVDPKTVGQYTYLHGHDGAEIWQGDIERAKHSTKGDYGIGQIIFADGMFLWQEITQNRRPMEQLFPLTEYELEHIGNIHDNPELLEANDERN